MSETLRRKIDGRLDTIERRLNRPDIEGTNIETEVREDLRDIYRKYARLEEEDSFEDYVVEYLSKETEREGREEPLCTCGDQLCPIRDGKVPRTRNKRILTGTEPFRERLRGWKRDHPGEPKALNEALNAYTDQYADIISDLAVVRGKVGAAIRQVAGDGDRDPLAGGSPETRSPPTEETAATDGGSPPSDRDE